MWWRLIAGAFIALASVTAMAEETVKFGAGDITDDDLLNNMGDVALGIETAYFYSAAHPSEKNKAFVEAMGTRTNNIVMLTARVSLSCSWDWRLVLRNEILLGAWHAVIVSPAVDHW